jgi:hypothetical protein
MSVVPYAYNAEYAKKLKMGDFKISYDAETKTLNYEPPELKANLFYNKAECDEKFAYKSNGFELVEGIS